MHFERCRNKEEIKPQILVPQNFYIFEKETQLSSVPCIRSFMLTAAEEVFENFISIQLRFAHYTWLNKKFMYNYLQTHSFGNAETKSVMHRDIFLFCFSTMLSHILSVNNYEAHVVICRKCVRKFIRKKVFEHFSLQTKQKIKITLLDFVCDEKSLQAFETFATYLYEKQIIKTQSVCYEELLTYDYDSKRLDWRILIWSWVHQVFKTLSTFQTSYDNIDHIYYFVKTLVFNVFTQIKCIQCSTHAYYSHLEDTFEKDFLIYIMDIIISFPQYWNEYGFMLHSVVNTRVKHATDGNGRCRIIMYEEYKKSMLPYLINDQLKQIFGIKQLYNVVCKSSSFNDYASSLPFKNTFFDDGYYDLDSIEIANNFLSQISKQKARENIEQIQTDPQKET